MRAQWWRMVPLPRSSHCHRAVKRESNEIFRESLPRSRTKGADEEGLVAGEEEPVGLCVTDDAIRKTHLLDHDLAKHRAQRALEWRARCVRPDRQDPAGREVALREGETVCGVERGVRRAEPLFRRMIDVDQDEIAQGI